MSKRRVREPVSSSSSLELSPEPKTLKMADDEQETPTLLMIYKKLTEIQEDIKAIKEENSEIKKEYEEIKKAVQFQSNTIDELTQGNAKLEAKCEEQQYELNTLKARMNNLDEVQDDLNQYQRKYNVEIHGIPEHDDEDLDEVVEELAKVIGVEDIEGNDIDIVHRLPSKLYPRPIIVKFKIYNDKKHFYAARWKLRNYQKDFDGEKLNGAKKVYINENLTSQRRKLFAEVRKRAKQYNWHSAWTLDGKVFLRKEKGGKVHKILQEADLEKVYYNE